ncbi:hypothetical protein TNCV_4053001 [Trichonephila clavipes]|nr:hypothetical protein TNCV_4053001 [Trichonephila clavipes]
MPYHKKTRKDDLINVLKESGEQATSKETIIRLKTKLEKSAAFKDDPDFVINLLSLSVEDRQAIVQPEPPSVRIRFGFDSDSRLSTFLFRSSPPSSNGGGGRGR